MNNELDQPIDKFEQLKFVLNQLNKISTVLIEWFKVYFDMKTRNKVLSGEFYYEDIHNIVLNHDNNEEDDATLKIKQLCLNNIYSIFIRELLIEYVSIDMSINDIKKEINKIIENKLEGFEQLPYEISKLIQRLAEQISHNSNVCYMYLNNKNEFMIEVSNYLKERLASFDNSNFSMWHYYWNN